MIFEKYNKDLSYSYVFGAFGTIELLNHKVKECKAVLVDPSFKDNEAYKKIHLICKQNNIPVIVDLKTISKIRDKGNIFVIGVFNKYTSSLSNNKHIVLNNINDVGSIGTIIRSMRGFSFENLVLINCNVDLYHEHLIRSTMGAFFSCNISIFDTIEEYMRKYPNQNMYQISKRGNDISTINNNDNISLVFSSENIVNEKVLPIKFNEDISLENIVNIVLFNLYS